MVVLNSHLNNSTGVNQYLFSNEELNTGIGDDVVKHNKEITKSNLIDGKSENIEPKTASSNTGGQFFKLYVVIFFITIDWISLKLFNFSFLHFFHIYK